MSHHSTIKLIVNFSNFSVKPYIVTPHMNRLDETVHMRSHTICLSAELTKIFPYFNQKSLLSRALSCNVYKSCRLTGKQCRLSSDWCSLISVYNVSSALGVPLLITSMVLTYCILVDSSTVRCWTSAFVNLGVPGCIAQLVEHLTRKSEVLGSIPGLATYFRFSFH